MITSTSKRRHFRLTQRSSLSVAQDTHSSPVLLPNLHHVTPQQLLTLQRTLGNQTVQRLLAEHGVIRGSQPTQPAPAFPVIQRMIVRMPTTFGNPRGLGRGVEDAEVDEMVASLASRGKEGAGGRHNWGDDWTFPSETEATYFVGHGNRSTFSGVSPSEFAENVLHESRQLKPKTAMKFVSCGGGKQKLEGAAFGQAVRDELERTGSWEGPLKAAEGLVFYTKAYKLILPQVPDTLKNTLSRLQAAAIRAILKNLVDAIREAFHKEKDISIRKKCLEELGLHVSSVASDYPALNHLAGRIQSEHYQKIIQNFEDAVIPEIPDLLREWFHKVDAFYTVDGLCQAIDRIDVTGSLVDDLKAAANVATAALRLESKKVWDQFKKQLGEVENASRKAPGEKLGTYPQPGGTGTDDARFTQWEDFGLITWKAWKETVRSKSD
jgi:hypothetical protein